jgi:hypothetical protein
MTKNGAEIRACFRFSKAGRAFLSSSMEAFLEKALPNFSSNSVDFRMSPKSLLS